MAELEGEALAEREGPTSAKRALAAQGATPAPNAAAAAAGVLQARLRMLPPRLRACVAHARAGDISDPLVKELQVLNYCQQLCLSRTACACEREWGGECVCVFVGMHIYTYACMHVTKPVFPQAQAF